MEYYGDVIFPLLRHLAPLPNTNDDIVESPLRVILNISTETLTDPTAYPFANERMASVSSCILCCTPSSMFSGHWSRPSAMFGSSLGEVLGVEESVKPPDTSFVDKLNVHQEYAVLVFGVRRAAVSLSFHVHRLKVLLEAGLVSLSSARFEFADGVLKEAQKGSLAHLPKGFSSHLHSLLNVADVGFCAKSPPCLLSLLPCCVHLSLHIGPCASTLSSAQALGAWYRFGRSGKHDVGHVGGDATDAGAIGNWW